MYDLLFIELQSDPGPYLPKYLLNSPLVLSQLFCCHSQKSTLKSQSFNSTPAEGVAGSVGNGVVTKI